ENAEVYLLDGTRLGQIRNIRKLEYTRVRSKIGSKKRRNSGKSV
ncbi:MAG: phosphoesterase, partial [Methanosarcina mazei]